jgi:hypothetical protein
VVERLAAGAGGADHHAQALDGLFLAGEVLKGGRAQGGLNLRLFAGGGGAVELLLECVGARGFFAHAVAGVKGTAGERPRRKAEEEWLGNALAEEKAWVIVSSPHESCPEPRASRRLGGGVEKIREREPSF